MPVLRELFDSWGRVATATGGCRGLGREMAEGLAAGDAALMLCARRETPRRRVGVDGERSIT